MLGVTEEELNEIKAIVEHYKDKYEFFAYGSRVKGNFRELSDLDLMIKGNESASVSDIDELKEKFDNSSLPYVVNFVDYFNLTKDFYNLIEKDLLKL